ncbi:MAG: 60S ribosomal export protein NMD3 [Thermoplasmata archaeon]|nr:60S ribosomal export protein NMD3 [Thermoplasmata archaeon]MCI4359858.1 60S ribosomal export protein NMD3 [Thermoplasmata archaeon]
MPEEFCVVCGRTDVSTEAGVCADCYAGRQALVKVPERPKVVLCPTCGARMLGAHWEGRGRSPTLLGAEDLYAFLNPDPEVAIRTVEWTEDSRHPLLREVEGTVHLRFRGTERTQRVAMTVKIEHRTCEDCSRRSGHYFTATIQLRGMEDRLREKSPQLRERLMRAWESALPEARPEWQRALSWFEERPEGYDFYLTDTLSARSLARLMKSRLSARLKESATLWGRKNGQDVYRVTLCLRVPPALPMPSAASGPSTGRSRRASRTAAL